MASDKPAPDALERMTDLGGMFYPVGHIFVAFSSEADARKAQDALARTTAGSSACRLLSGRQVAEVARRQLEQNTGFLATLGRSDEKVQQALDTAEQGGAFLLIKAPSSDEAARVMEAVRHVPYKFARRYHEMAIEELK